MASPNKRSQKSNLLFLVAILVVLTGVLLCSLGAFRIVMDDFLGGALLIFSAVFVLFAGVELAKPTLE